MEYTSNLNSVIHYAAQEAQRLGNREVLPDHMVLGMLRLSDCTACQLLQRTGVDLARLKHAIDDHFFNAYSSDANLPYSRATARILRLTTIETGLYGTDVAGTAHLLLAVLRERICFVDSWLENEYGINYEKIESLFPKPGMADDMEESDGEDDYDDENAMPDLFKQLAGSLIQTETEENPRTKSKSGTPFLDKFGRDLTQLALDGKLDPVVGRETEIARVLNILARRKKNNPILIGEPGVGKSAIVEAIAQQLVRTEKNTRRVVALDMAAIVAGTTYRGQFEQRMNGLIKELRKHPEIILFVDEIHTIIGAGNAQGGLDAANILKPALARGEMQCIGATTTAEYRKSVERDGALERRFQKVVVSAPSVIETFSILQGLAGRYGDFHHVTYSEEALWACARLTNRYVSDRFLPDKAIDAMDEAGTRGRGTISAEDIAKVVSTMSGVPIQRVAHKENEQLLHMDTMLKSRVIGQDDAVDKLVRAIRRSRLGLQDPNRPIGSFFFLGPTGVGKTYLAQCLAEEMFGSRDAIIRFDMSEYMEKHAVSLLVGAPPGYIAHEDGGKLTEAVRRQPYSIILLDEIEKAHPDIFNIFLQVLDEGRLTDRQGHYVDFRNTIIILTSNVGTRQLRDFGAGVGFGTNEITSDIAEKTTQKALAKTFPPEFVNRIDDIISFAPLSRTSLARIVDIEIAKLQTRLREQGHRLSVGEQARNQLLDYAYDPKNGARPVKRAIQKYLENRIMDKLMLKPEIKTLNINRL